MAEKIDVIREQEATLARPRRTYGTFARMLFWGMDTFYGKELTLGKVRLLEILARIPYQAWEIRKYREMNHEFENPEAVKKADDLIRWGREAQDNEFWHLQVLTEKIRETGTPLNWFKDTLIPKVAAFKYILFCRALAFFNIQAAFMLNADFEDHAEHEYMHFVKTHPELEQQPVTAEVVTKYGDFKTWADVFRRIALDERDHMNNSLIHAGRAAEVVGYVSK